MYQQQLTRLIGQLAMGLAAGFLLILGLRLTLLPHFGLGAHSPYLLLALAFIGAALFLPSLSRATSRWQTLTFSGLLFVTLMLLMLTSAWQIGIPSLWKLPLLAALAALIASVLTLMAHPLPPPILGFGRPHVVLSLVFLLFLAIVGVMVWNGPGGMPQDANILIRALVAGGALLLVWSRRLSGGIYGETLERNLESCAAFLLLWLTLCLCVLTLGYDWFNQHSQHAIPATRVGVLIFLFPLVLLTYFNARFRSWLPSLMLLIAFVFSYGLPPAPDVVLPMVPVAALIAGLFMPHRRWPMAIALWAIILAPFVNWLGAQHAQLVMAGLVGSVVLSLSLWMNRGLALIASTGSNPAPQGNQQLNQQLNESMIGKVHIRLGSILGLAASLLMTSLGSAWLVYDLRSQRQALKEQTDIAANYLATNLAESLKRAEHLAHAMGRLRHMHNLENQLEFEQETDELVQMAGDGIILQWASGTTLRFIHPLAGHETAVGLNLLERPDVSAAVQQMIETGGPIWQGPAKLVQGGTGMLYRVPIYHPENGAFLGIANSLIIFPDVLLPFKDDQQEFAFRVAIGHNRETPIEIFADAHPSNNSPDAATVPSHSTLHIDYGPHLLLLARNVAHDHGSTGLVSIDIEARAVTNLSVQQLPLRLQLLVIGAVILGWLVRSLVLGQLQRKALARIQAEFTQMEQVLAHSIVGNLIADGNGNIIWQNPRASQVLNTPASVIRNTNLLQNRLWRENHWHDLAQATLADGHSRCVEYHGPGSLGQDIDVEMTLSRTRLGGIDHLLVQLLYLGDQRRLQRELADANTNLERKVEKRTLALEQSKAFSESLLDTMGSVFVLLDAKGRIQRFNQAAQRITGYTFEQLYKQPIWDHLIPPESYDNVRNVFDKLFHDRIIGYFENEWVTRSGVRRLFAWHNTVLYDANGDVEHVMAIGIDITQQRANEHDLQRHRQQLEQLVEERTAQIVETNRRLEVATRATGVGTWVMDLASGVAEWSPFMYEIYGIPGHEREQSITFDFFIRRVHPDDVALISTEYQTMLKGKEDRAINEFRVLWPDGTVRHVQFTVIIERDDNGKPIRLIGSDLDVTETRQVEQALRDSQLRLQNILESAQAGTWEWNVQTGEARFNPRWAEIIGFGLWELAPTSIDTWTRFVHPDDMPMSNRMLEAHFAGDTEYYDCQARMRHRDGHWVWIQDHGKVVSWTDEGKPEWMYGTHLDITERKRLELDLIAASERAEQSSAAKSEFLSNMSHEIRTPLNAILGHLQLLGSTSLDATQASYAHKAYNASRILVGVIGDILDFSRIEANRLSLQIEPFSLRGELTNVTNVLDDEARKKGLNLTLTTDPGCPDELLGDALRINQVLLNLAGNAVKFTEQGAISIRVTPDSTQPSTENAIRLLFEIEDSGIGIAEDRLQAIFDRFTQVDSSPTRVYSGSGLGLSISAGLLHLMQGEIGVTSVPGEGSRFWFVLPLALDQRRQALPADAGRMRRASDQIPTLVGDALRGMHILSVEDNPLNQEAITALLSGMGASVEQAANGLEAVALVVQAKQTFDLVLMDMQMPEMDGLEATRQLRQVHGISDLPIIALTANAQAGDREVCLTAGMDDYLTKPVDIAILRDVVGRLRTRSSVIRVSTDARSQSTGVEVPHHAFDMQSAIARLGGRADVYARLVTRFLNDIDSTMAELSELMIDSAPVATEKATEILHTLRGTALTLGASELANTALEIETALTDGDEGSRVDMLDRLNLSLKRALGFLRENSTDSRS